MSKLKLGEFLLKEKLINDSQLAAALNYQKRWNKKLGAALLDLNLIKEKKLYETLSRVLQIPIIDLTRIDPASLKREILNCIPADIAKEHRVVPVSVQKVRGKERLIVATSDPLNYEALTEVRYNTPLSLFPMIAPDKDIDWFLLRYYMKHPNSPHYVSVVQIKKLEQDRNRISIVESIFEDSLFDSNTKVRPSKKD